MNYKFWSYKKVMNLWENALETKNRKFLAKRELGVNCYAMKCDQHVHALIIISNNISDNNWIKNPWIGNCIK